MRLLIVLMFLTACDEKALCVPRVNQEMRKQVFLECLKLTGEARKGVNYTTNDDEDYDEVVSECRRASYYIAESRDHCHASFESGK